MPQPVSTPRMISYGAISSAVFLTITWCVFEFALDTHREWRDIALIVSGLIAFFVGASVEIRVHNRAVNRFYQPHLGPHEEKPFDLD